MLKFKNIMHINAVGNIPLVWLKDFVLSVRTKEYLSHEQLTNAVLQVIAKLEKEKKECAELNGEQIFAHALAEMHPEWEIEAEHSWDLRIDQFDREFHCLTMYRQG